LLERSTIFVVITAVPIFKPVLKFNPFQTRVTEASLFDCVKVTDGFPELLLSAKGAVVASVKFTPHNALYPPDTLVKLSPVALSTIVRIDPVSAERVMVRYSLLILIVVLVAVALGEALPTPEKLTNINQKKNIIPIRISFAHSSISILLP
jgi:hypothetical protein